MYYSSANTCSWYGTAIIHLGLGILTFVENIAVTTVTAEIRSILTYGVNVFFLGSLKKQASIWMAVEAVASASSAVFGVILHRCSVRCSVSPKVANDGNKSRTSYIQASVHQEEKFLKSAFNSSTKLARLNKLRLINGVSTSDNTHP